MIPYCTYLLQPFFKKLRVFIRGIFIDTWNSDFFIFTTVHFACINHILKNTVSEVVAGFFHIMKSAATNVFVHTPCPCVYVKIFSSICYCK